MSKSLKIAALGLEHRHVFGMAQNLIDAGAEFAGWWNDRDPDLRESFEKRFPSTPQVADKSEILNNPDIDLIV